MPLWRALWQIIRRFGFGAQVSLAWECEAIEIEPKDGWAQYRPGPLRTVLIRAQ